MNLVIYSYYEIDDIGSSPEYFWIRSGDNLYPFDPFSSMPAKRGEAMDEIDFINWGHSRNGVSGNEIEISSYIIEGDWSPKRLVIIEFEDVNRGMEWYNSEEYSQALRLRHKSAQTNLVFIEGVS